MSSVERRAGAVILLAGLAAHGAALLNGFVLDDFMYIVHNPAVANPGSWMGFFTDRFSLASDPDLSGIVYRPLQGLCYALNAAWGGVVPFNFHVVDLLLHAASSWALFIYLSRRLGAGAGTWAGALLFLLHPAQAQSVAYASGRCGLQAFLFGLLALLTAASRKEARVLPALLYGLSLFSKESGIAWLAVLAADDWVFGPRRTARERLRRLAPYLAATALYLAARVLVLGRVAQRGPWEGTWPAHALVAGRALLQDFGIALLAVPLREPHGFPKGRGYGVLSLAGLTLFAAVGGAGSWGAWRRRSWGLGLLWFWTALLPVSQIVPFTALAADRFLYAPLGGFALTLAAVVGRRLSAVAAAGALAVAVLMGLRCAELHLAWRSPFTLALHGHHASGGEAYASLRLASHYLEARRFERAEALIHPALAVDQIVDVRRLGFKRLGTLRLRQGRAADAVAALQECLAFEPRQKSALILLAQAQRALGDPAAEAAALARAAAIP